MSRSPVTELLLDRSETGVATLTSNRPRRRNAVRPSGWEEPRRLVHEVAHGASTRVVVISGAGGDSFADILSAPGAHGLGLVNHVTPDAEAVAQTVNILSDDMQEGVAAFLQRRSPVFRGR